MSVKLIYSLIPTNSGGSVNVEVDAAFETVSIRPATAITLGAAYNVSATGTPTKGTFLTFLYAGNITTDTSTGKSVNIFGTELSDIQALYEGEITAYYNGSAWEVKIFPDSESGLANLDGGDIKAASIGTAALADDAITNDKLNSITRGSIKVGGASDAPIDLNAKTNGYILIGDGTDLNSVAVSGDITIDNTGVTTIGAGKVTNAMLATPPQTYYTLSRKVTSAELLALYATPLTLLTAPGINKAIKLLIGYAWLDYNSATYAGGGDIQFKFGSDVMGTISSSIVKSSSDILGNFGATGSATTGSLNQALTLTNATAAFTTGDSDLRIVLYYTIEDFDF